MAASKKVQATKTTPKAAVKHTPKKEQEKPAPVVKKAPAVKAVRVPDDDVRPHQFANIVIGDHTGRYGYYTDVVATDGEGAPETVVFITRDQHTERIVVNVGDLRPDQDRPRGGR